MVVTPDVLRRILIFFQFNKFMPLILLQAYAA